MSNVLTSHSCAWQTHDRSLLAPSPSSPRSSSVLTLHSFVSQQAPPAPISNQLQSINLRTVPSSCGPVGPLCLWEDFTLPVKTPGCDASRLFAPGRRWRPAYVPLPVPLLLQHLLCGRSGWLHKPIGNFPFNPQRLQMQLIPICVLKGTVHPRIPRVVLWHVELFMHRHHFDELISFERYQLQRICLLSYIMELVCKCLLLSSNHRPVSQHTVIHRHCY